MNGLREGRNGLREGRNGLPLEKNEEKNREKQYYFVAAKGTRSL
jgi:hypothetical protein